MQGYLNSRIIGASAIGFALVLGAYTLSDFGAAPELQQPAAATAAMEPPPRVSIAVTDEDQNGIEDWRDEFITTEPIVLTNSDSEPYTPPDTLTGQMGIDFMQGIIRAQGYGPFSRSQEEVIDDTVNQLTTVTEHELYDTPDIIIMDSWDDEDIRNYANTMAAILYRHSVPDLDHELNILHAIVREGETDRMDEIETLADVYTGYRDDSLQVPVPAIFAKEHLDLINTYNAIQSDLAAMTLADADPAQTLLRLKRYEDDADGLWFALQNLYLALEPHASLFTVDDPAALFVAYSPTLQL